MLDFVERITKSRTAANYVLIAITLAGIVFIAIMLMNSGSSVPQPTDDLINAIQPNY